MTIYRDRSHAGKKLAAHLLQSERPANPVVLALPRGGVPVAFEVASALGVTMDVFVVRKLGVPGQMELAMGAIASGGIRIVNDAIVRQAGLSDKDVAAAATQEQMVLERRERIYREGRSSLNLNGRPIIVVDDGMATGASMHAAVLALRRLNPSEIVVAVPVASKAACAVLEQAADRVICLETPDPFRAVGRLYHEFAQITDAEVLHYMGRAIKD